MRNFLRAVGILAISCSYAEADALIPRHLQYDFERLDDASATSCHVVLTLVNYPQPEGINIKFLAARGKEPNSPIFVGFSVDVGDSQFRNGLPEGMTKASLQSASFSSNTFSSAGRLNSSVTSDGGVIAATADATDAGAFLQAFEEGNFAISFKRDGEIVGRSYFVKDAPPPDVMLKFTGCAKALTTR